MNSQVLQGDALAILRTLPSGSVNCCVTSPPYWGLRDYGTAKWEGGQAGCDHVAMKRPPVIGSSSTLGFPADGGARRISKENTYHEAYTTQFRETCGKCGARRVDAQLGLERTPEEYVARLVEVFREVRRVLRDDGTLWLNLGDSYAHNGACGGGSPDGPRKPRETDAVKQRAMSYAVPPGLKPKDLVGIPWSVAFALRADGWWLRSDIIWNKPAPMPESVTDRPTRSHEYIFLLAKAERYYCNMEAIKEPASNPDDRLPHERMRTRNTISNSVPNYGRPSAPKGSFNGKTEAMADTGQNAFRAVTETRNKRDVWTVNTKPFLDAHFATFPEELIEPCIFAGCPEGGTILDPFAGACTTGLVAEKWGRNSVLIELNPEYCEMGKKRVDSFAPLFQHSEAAID